MSTYAADFPSRFFNFLLKETGFKKENFSKEKLVKVVEKFKSLNLSHEVQNIIIDVVKAIVGFKNSVQDVTVFLVNKFLDVLFHVLDFLREFAVARIFLSLAELFGSNIVRVLLMILYYLSDHVSCDMLKNFKNYIKEKCDSYYNSYRAIQY